MRTGAAGISKEPGIAEAVIGMERWMDGFMRRCVGVIIVLKKGRGPLIAVRRIILSRLDMKKHINFVFWYLYY